MYVLAYPNITRHSKLPSDIVVTQVLTQSNNNEFYMHGSVKIESHNNKIKRKIKVTGERKKPWETDQCNTTMTKLCNFKTLSSSTRTLFVIQLRL